MQHLPSPQFVFDSKIIFAGVGILAKAILSILEGPCRDRPSIDFFPEIGILSRVSL